MMRLTAIFLLFLYGCSGSLGSGKKDQQEKASQGTHIEAERLKSDLIGDWHYVSSETEDSSFVIAQLGDLSRFYAFESGHADQIAAKYPKLAAFGKDKLLFGLRAQHETRPFGEYSYPLVNLVAKDSSRVRVTHYQPGNGVGKTYGYFITDVSADTLRIVNERRYALGEGFVSGLCHVYVRRK